MSTFCRYVEIRHNRIWLYRMVWRVTPAGVFQHTRTCFHWQICFILYFRALDRFSVYPFAVFFFTYSQRHYSEDNRGVTIPVAHGGGKGVMAPPKIFARPIALHVKVLHGRFLPPSPKIIIVTVSSLSLSCCFLYSRSRLPTVLRYVSLRSSPEE